MSAFDSMSVVEQYLAWDPNESTRAELQSLVDDSSAEAKSQIETLMGKRVAFGTAGLRAPMGLGYCRMNELVILQTVQGLIRYLQGQLGKPEVRKRGVVLGYDHRRYQNISSEGFALISAAVFISEGIKVYLLSNNIATPFVAYAVTQLNCCAGIMVTASHNPKRDNGYKVYWGNGSQIIPPHDAGIASSILENLAPWKKYDYSRENVYAHPMELFEDCTVSVTNSYYSSIRRLCLRSDTNSSTKAQIAYTAMHGIGHQWIKRAFEVFNHRPFVAVPSQQEPDPDFSTVAFPNPEEKGALDEAMKFGLVNGCTVIVANDPDADRLGIAERKAGTNEWVILTGNEIGALLGHYQMMKWKGRAEVENRKHGVSPSAAVCASVVSSRMLKKIALAEGVQYYDTLTGFKWLGNKAIELKAKGVDVLFLYEEALGFCVGDVVCDKDGLSAAAVFAEMVSELTAAAGSADNVIQNHLQSLYDTYGEFVSYNSYVISHDPKVTDMIFHRLRNAGGHTATAGGGYWQSCAGSKITAIKDITMGYDSTASESSDNANVLPTTPDSHMIMFEFENGCSVTLRTSGTEPKIKFYTEIAGKVGEDRSFIKDKLHTFIDQLVDEMLQPNLHGLARP